MEEIRGGAVEVRETDEMPSEEKLPPETHPNFRGIEISHSSNGYIIRVGCKTFIIEGTIDRLLNNLKMYLTNPEITESNFYRGELTLV